MTPTQLKARNTPTLPIGTYYGSGPVCDIHTYFGPAGAEVTFKRKYSLGADHREALPLKLSAEQLAQILCSHGELIQVATMGRAR